MGVCGIDINHEKYVLTAGGCLSIVCLSIIFYLFYYLKIPNLKRHPTTLAIHKCWFEVIFVSQYLWLSFVPESFFWETTTDDVASCVVNAQIWPFAFLTEFSLLGANALYYTGFVYSLAILMATILVSMVPIRYGLSTDPMIWVHDQKDKTNNVKIAMFYFYMFVIYLYCGFIAWWSRNQISKGLEDTLRVRKYSVNKQTKYVFGYFVFWTLVFAFEFLNYLKTDFDWDFMSNGDENILRTVSAFLLASRGIWSLGIFLWANWNEIYQHLVHSSGGDGKQPPKEAQELVQLNIVLQKEIVRFTGLGIQKAAREINVIMEAQNSASRSSLASNIFFLHTKMPGESVSFVVIDPDMQAKSRDHSTATLNGASASLAAAVTDNEGRLLSFSTKPSFSAGSSNRIPTYKDPIGASSANTNSSSIHSATSINPMQQQAQSATGRGSSSASPFEGVRSSVGVGIGSLETHMEVDLESNRSVSVAATAGSDCDATVRMGGDALDISGDGGVESQQQRMSDEELDRIQERRGYLPSTAEVNFSLENKQMERQYSTATDSVRASTLSTLMNSMSPFITRRRRDNFLFTDYSPKRFAKLRALSGISIVDYMESFKSTTMPSFSEGKSGAFIYFSSDYKYIVKTTTKREFEKLLSILPDMEKYFEEEAAAWRKPLITRFFGAHRIVMYDIPLYFVVMQNVLPSVDEKYDLKGSWVNRHGSKKGNNAERARPKKNSASTHDSKAKGSSTPLFLDNDLQNCFLLRPDVAKAVSRQLARDVKFLEKFNLMDYSLLIGVRRRNFEILDNQSDVSGDLSAQNLQSLKGNPFHQDRDGAFHAAVVEGQGTFYIGLIDILQEWNWQKWYERMFKVYVLQKDGNGLSAIDPLSYRKRFLQRAVLDVLDGVEDLTVENMYDDISSLRPPTRPTSPAGVKSPPSGGSTTSSHGPTGASQASMARMISERGYDFNDPTASRDHISSTLAMADVVAASGGGRMNMNNSFSGSVQSFNMEARSSDLDALTPSERTGSGNSNGSNNSKYKGTDHRFSVTPMNVRR